MPFQTVHDVQRGIARLMNAPRDLPASAPWVDPPRPLAQASDAHKELFEQYLEIMEACIDIAEQWWDGLLTAQREHGRTEEEALDVVYARRVAGPASRPEVVWTIRTHWLACVAINETLPESERIPPEVFLLHWICDGEHDEWVQVVSGMPHWPIGLDEDHRWV